MKTMPIAKIHDSNYDELIASRLKDAHLTPKEYEVLKFCLVGMCHKVIARAMKCKPNSVQYHSRSIMKKLGVSTRLELLALFIDVCCITDIARSYVADNRGIAKKRATEQATGNGLRTGNEER